MSFAEKAYSLLAVCYITALAVALAVSPQVRQLPYLLPLSLLGVAVNVGLLYVVFKDIFSRRFANPYSRYIWVAAIFLFMPAILVYLPLHGFRKR
ncbi:MAG: hypothetical protein LJE64_07275 [Desulfofustis sp.]|jgi:hypothetical protein|nr:hypothetical protein [Desulfofustis sp.]